MKCLQKAKGIEHKDLWKKKLKESSTTDAYMNTLNLDDEALKNFIQTRVSDFDKIRHISYKEVPTLF